MPLKVCIYLYSVFIFELCLYFIPTFDWFIVLLEIDFQVANSFFQNRTLKIIGMLSLALTVVDEEMPFFLNRWFSFVLLSPYGHRGLLIGWSLYWSPKYYHVGALPSVADTHKSCLNFPLKLCSIFFFSRIALFFCLQMGCNTWVFCVTSGEWHWVGLWLHIFISN